VSALPEASTVYATALEALNDSHELEAAALLARCRLEIVPTEVVDPWRKELQPVRLVLHGPDGVIAALGKHAEIRGRVRRALDGALGPTTYVAHLVLTAQPNALAA
jgi:hypothetical protein